MTDSLRAWFDDLLAYGLEVIFDQRRGKVAAILRAVLYVISKLVHLYLRIQRISGLAQRFVKSARSPTSLIKIKTKTTRGRR